MSRWGRWRRGWCPLRPPLGVSDSDALRTFGHGPASRTPFLLAQTPPPPAPPRLSLGLWSLACGNELSALHGHSVLPKALCPPTSPAPPPANRAGGTSPRETGQDVPAPCSWLRPSGRHSEQLPPSPPPPRGRAAWPRPAQGPGPGPPCLPVSPPAPALNTKGQTYGRGRGGGRRGSGQLGRGQEGRGCERRQEGSFPAGGRGCHCPTWGGGAIIRPLPCSAAPMLLRGSKGSPLWTPPASVSPSVKP